MKAQLDISTMSSSDYAELTETSAGSGVFTNENYSVHVQQVYGFPSYKTCLVVTDGVTLSNTLFSIWETAPQSGIYRNYHEAIPTDLSPAQLAVPDFVPWQLKIGGVTDTSLVSQVSITTLVDSTNQVTFSVVKGALLSDQKFILIPDDTPEAPPPQGYVALRTDTLQSRWWDEEQKNITASVTLKSGTRAPDVKLDEAKQDRPGAVVIQSFRWYEPTEWGPGWVGLGKLDTETRIAKLFEEMGYTVVRNFSASKADALENLVKGATIWYSISHGGTEKGEPTTPFLGLKFKDGAIRTSELPPNMNYKLVMLDACHTAQTSLESQEKAQDTPELLQHCKDFANAFGPNVAYMGWAWKTNPWVDQKLSSDLLNNLKFDPKLGRGRSVLEAYAKVLQNNLSSSEAWYMKIYGKTGHIIDTRKEKK